MFDLENLVNRLSNVSHFKVMPESAIRDIVFAGAALPRKAIEAK